MAEPTGAPPDVVQAHRFELLDRNGQIRGVIGELPTPEDGPPPVGVALFDESGNQRVFVSLDKTGPKLAFDHHGNNVLELGVNDETDDALAVGAYALATDGGGTPRVAVRVHDDGGVELVHRDSAA